MARKITPRFRYEIEVGGLLSTGLDLLNCNVVDLTRPNGGHGEGFAHVFSGTFAECDAWLEAHPDILHPRGSLGVAQDGLEPLAHSHGLREGGER